MRVPYPEVFAVLQRVLLRAGLTPERADLCARLFADTSRDGVYSHGLNRFPRFMEQVTKGVVNLAAEPVRVKTFGALERWDGQRGPGNLNAHAAMARAIMLCREHGLGAVALANTNHWMRGGSYGWQAAEAGVIGICWTNTMANLPPWGTRDPRVGNNPLVLAVPHPSSPVVLDMAMSQFSFGALESYRLRGETLPVPGGFDKEGKLTQDPAAIEASGQALPIGYWKGSGLALLLDMIGALLAGGLATHQITRDVILESGLSQIFVAFDLPSIDAEGTRHAIVEGILASLGPSPAAPPAAPMRHPGARVLQIRKENLAQGIPVAPHVWTQIQAL